MNAYLIDPVQRTVTEVPYDGKLKSIYGMLACDIVEAVRFGQRRDAIYVDEEGLLHLQPDTMFFTTTLAPGYKLAGRGLVVGMDKDGADKAPFITFEDFKKSVSFYSLDEIRLLTLAKYRKEPV